MFIIKIKIYKNIQIYFNLMLHKLNGVRFNKNIINKMKNVK